MTGWQAIRVDGGGWGISRDATHTLCTPAGKPVVVPTVALAQAVAEEWDQVRGAPRPAQIPLTRYVNTTLDHIRPDREQAIGSWLKTVHADVLCYRAVDPLALVTRQTATWDPLLDRLEAEVGIRMQVRPELMPFAQPSGVEAALREAASGLDDFHLMALGEAGSLLVSAALSLLFVRGGVSLDVALESSLLDELYQSDQWGEPEELVTRRADLRRELEQLDLFLGLLRPVS